MSWFVLSELIECVCVYVCIYIYMCVCMYVCMCVCVCMYVCMYVCVCVCVYKKKHCVSVCLHLSTKKNTQTYQQIQTCSEDKENDPMQPPTLKMLVF